ncbi:MAG: pentapeptide repeat-containing protein [Clostridiales bacterium]|jgi:uncharacterized protein YjbI with pentapeptide repeats|nr:pentapeptide repeat-containing protein [Clostridiales bacterium]
MKLNKPVLPQAPETADDLPALLSAVREDETDITERLIAEASLTEKELDGLCFRSSRLENCRFVGCSFHRAAFLDVVFEGCDLSNSDFDSAFFQRCRFHNCKGVGALLARARLFHIAVEDCDFRYSVWDTAQLRRVCFTGGTLDKSSFGDCAFDPVEFHEASLIGAGFLRTSLDGVRLTTCQIAGLQAAGPELKGAIVTAYQAAELARLLGVVIQDPESPGE